MKLKTAFAIVEEYDILIFDLKLAHPEISCALRSVSVLCNGSAVVYKPYAP